MLTYSSHFKTWTSDPLINSHSSTFLSLYFILLQKELLIDVLLQKRFPFVFTFFPFIADLGADLIQLWKYINGQLHYFLTIEKQKRWKIPIQTFNVL